MEHLVSLFFVASRQRSQCLELTSQYLIETGDYGRRILRFVGPHLTSSENVIFAMGLVA